MQTTQKMERKDVSKIYQIPAKRERVRRVSDRETSEVIREALRTTASGFLAQYEVSQ